MEAVTVVEKIQRIKDLLGQLKAADTNFGTFGAKSHKYELRPPCREEDLQAFEHSYNIQLPDDYRLFLLKVGNGIAGPNYGLQTLEEAAHYRNLVLPFLLTKNSEFYSYKELDSFCDTEEYDCEYPGLLEICHHGCAIYSYLVVNGPTYGTIWDGREDFYATGQTFFEWYENWAAKALKQSLNEPFIEKVQVGMTKDEVQFVAPGNWYERPVGNQDEPPRVIFYEATDFRAQLELGADRRVVKINRF